MMKAIEHSKKVFVSTIANQNAAQKIDGVNGYKNISGPFFYRSVFTRLIVPKASSVKILNEFHYSAKKETDRNQNYRTTCISFNEPDGHQYKNNGYNGNQNLIWSVRNRFGMWAIHNCALGNRYKKSIKQWGIDLLTVQLSCQMRQGGLGNGLV